MIKNTLKLFCFLAFSFSYSQNSNIIILSESTDEFETLVAEYGSTLSISWDVQIPEQEGNYIEYGFVKIDNVKTKKKAGTDTTYKTDPPKSVQNFRFKNLKYPLELYNKKITPGNYEVLINHRFYSASKGKLMWGKAVRIPLTIVGSEVHNNKNSYAKSKPAIKKAAPEEPHGAPINVLKKGNKITVTSTDEILSVMIYDMDGNEILFFNKTNNLKVSKLFPGKYIAKASNGSKAEFTID